MGMRGSRGRLACRFVVVALTVGVAAVFGGMDEEEVFRVAPPFRGTVLGTPPHQDAPWELPSTKLPDEVVDACGVLFEQGFADPRGCEYRAIEVGTGEMPPDGAVVTRTHGWVLPDAGEAGQRFAVCWNGLVYPTLSVGEAADLREDVLAGLESDRHRAQREEGWRREAYGTKALQEMPYLLRWRNWHAQGERAQISPQTIHPLKVPVLLRLGEVDLAEQLWHQWRDSLYARSAWERLLTHAYGALATEWLWARFNRMVFAFVRGDNNLAACDVERLVVLEPLVRAAVGERGVPGEDILECLSQLPRIAADLKRRAAEPDVQEFPSLRTIAMQLLLEPVDWSELAAAEERWRNELHEKYPDPSARAGALIRMLDEVSGAPGTRGQVIFGPDPVLEELIRVGDPAVPQLLEVLEKDQRLTCSVEGERRVFGRWIPGVERAAWHALNFTMAGAPLTGDEVYYAPRWIGRQEGIAHIEGIIERYLAFSPEERGASVRAGLQLEFAIRDMDGHPAAVREILDRHPELCDHQTHDYEPVIVMVARGGNLAAVRLLLEKGSDVNAVDKDGCTALDHALFYSTGHGAVDLLRANGAKEGKGIRAVLDAD